MPVTFFKKKILTEIYQSLFHKLTKCIHHISLQKQKVSQALSDCVNYIHAVHFPGFAESASSGKCYHMSSFGESKVEEYTKSEGANREFITYNCRQISRVYPKATRQDSSNFSPIPYWNMGSQFGKWEILKFS